MWVALVGGAVVGLPQTWVLRSKAPGWRWWTLVSSVGWAIQFPGALPGAWLVYVTRDRPT